MNPHHPLADGDAMAAGFKAMQQAWSQRVSMDIEAQVMQPVQ
jgi:hypothetical protein